MLIPKRDNLKRGYTKGVELTKVKLVEFNAGSRDHVAIGLQKKYKWKPKQFTPTGKPEVNEDILKSLPYPEAVPLAHLFMLDKRMAMIATGKAAWMKYIKNGIIHPVVIPNGAVTGRMTHSRPNVSQVTRPGNPYGVEMRQCWVARKDRVLAGCDADGSEMRALGH